MSQQLDLICAPHAGGGAMFYLPWQQMLGDGFKLSVLVRPGNEHRRREPALRRMSDVVELALAEHDFDRPYVLFGHSLGAAVAFELARELADRGAPPPVRLIVSGRRPPQIPLARRPAHDLPRDEFVQRLVELNGVPPEILERPEILDLFLDGLRADFEVNEFYSPDRLVLDTPITALTGDRDPAVSILEMMQWKSNTTKSFRLHVLPGDHFYLRHATPDLVRAITTGLNQQAGVLVA